MANREKIQCTKLRLVYIPSSNALLLLRNHSPIESILVANANQQNSAERGLDEQYITTKNHIN